MNFNAFSVELKVMTPIGHYRLPLVTGGAEPRKVVGLLGLGSKIRSYTPVYKYPNDGVQAIGDSVATGDHGC